jgi:hypothetical protein
MGVEEGFFAAIQMQTFQKVIFSLPFQFYFKNRRMRMEKEIREMR